MNMDAPLPKNLDNLIQQLDEAQLRVLKDKVIERLNLIHRAKRLKSLAKFNLYDKVYFDHDGEKIFGRIIRINQKTCTIQTEDRGEWRIPPSFLIRITEVADDDIIYEKAAKAKAKSKTKPKNQPVAQLPFAGMKISRNAKCPCGSDKKYKHCCGKT